MRKILSYAKNYKAPAFIALALMGIELVVELVQPLLMARIIDEGILKEDFSIVSGWGGLLLGLSLLAFAAGITNSFFAAKLSQGVGYDLRRDLFTKVQHFTNENFQSFSTPGLITRMTNDVTQIQNFLFMFVRIALRAPLFIVFAVIMALSINADLALLIVVAVPVFLLFLFWVLFKGVKLFKLVQNKLDRVNTVIRENLTGIRLIKGFNRGDYEETRFKEVNDSLVDKNKRALWLMETTMPVVMLGMNITILLIIWLGAENIQAGNVQAGELVALINYATRIMFTFSIFTFLIMVFSRGNASAHRLGEVLEERTPSYLSETNGKKPELKGSLLFEQVSYRQGSEEVLHQVSFHVRSGETVGVLGETGSGKSSLLRLIPRLYEKQSGQLYLDDNEISELNVKHIRSQISLVPQDIHLFSGSIRDNILWGKEDAEMEEVIEAAKKAQIHSFILTLSDGYDTLLGQKGLSLSGGQKQRLSIARALIRKPAILILDDSTSALDAHTETELLRPLEKEACTVFMVAQKISSLKQAQKILLLEDGYLIAEGTHQTLLARSPYYREVYMSQQEEAE